MNTVKYEWKPRLENQRLKYIDLSYLNNYADFDAALMVEIITLYLQHEPQLLHAVKQSSQYKDWKSLFTAVHKMIPSLAIMGLSKQHEKIIRQIQEYAREQTHLDELPALVLWLEIISRGVCIELEEELQILKEI